MKLDINISTSFIGTTDTMINNLVSGEVGAKSTDFSAILQESALAQLPIPEKNNTLQSSDLMIDIPTGAKLIHTLEAVKEQSVVKEITLPETNTDSQLHTSLVKEIKQAENTTVYHFPFQSVAEDNTDIKNAAEIRTGLTDRELKVSDKAQNKNDRTIVTEHSNGFIAPEKEEREYAVTDKNIHTENTKSEITKRIEEIQNTLTASTKSKVQLTLLNDKPDDIQVRVDISATTEKEIPAILEAIIGNIWLPMQKQEQPLLFTAEQDNGIADTKTPYDENGGESNNFKTVLNDKIENVVPQQKTAPVNTENEVYTENSINRSIQNTVKNEEPHTETAKTSSAHKTQSGKNNYKEIVVSNKQTATVQPAIQVKESAQLQVNTPYHNTVWSEKQSTDTAENNNAVHTATVSEKRDTTQSQKIIEVFVENIFPTETKAELSEINTVKEYKPTQSALPKTVLSEHTPYDTPEQENVSKTDRVKIGNAKKNTENISEIIIPEHGQSTFAPKPSATSIETKLSVGIAPKQEKTILYENEPSVLKENIVPKAEIKSEIPKGLRNEEKTVLQMPEIYTEYIPEENAEIVQTKTEKNSADKNGIEKPILQKENTAIREYNKPDNEKKSAKEIKVTNNETKAIISEAKAVKKENVSNKPKQQEITTEVYTERAEITAYPETTEKSEQPIVDEEVSYTLVQKKGQNNNVSNDKKVEIQSDTIDIRKNTPKSEIADLKIERKAEQKISVVKPIENTDTTVKKSAIIAQRDDMEFDTSIEGEYKIPKDEVHKESIGERKNVVISYSAKDIAPENKGAIEKNESVIMPKSKSATESKHVEINNTISDKNAVKPIAITQNPTEAEYTEIHTKPLTQFTANDTVMIEEEIPENIIHTIVNTKEPITEIKSEVHRNISPLSETKNEKGISMPIRGEKKKEVLEKSETIIENKKVYKTNTDDLPIHDEPIAEYTPKAVTNGNTQNEEKSNVKTVVPLEYGTEQENIVTETKPQIAKLENGTNNNTEINGKYSTVQIPEHTQEHEYSATEHSTAELKAGIPAEGEEMPKAKEPHNSLQNNAEKTTVSEQVNNDKEYRANKPNTVENTQETIELTSPETVNNEKQKTIVPNNDKDVFKPDMESTEIISDEVQLTGENSEQITEEIKGTLRKEIPTQKTKNEIKPIQLDNEQTIIENNTPQIEKPANKNESIQQVLHTTVQDDNVQTLPQIEKEVIENVSVKESIKAAKPELKPIVQEQKNTVQEHKPIVQESKIAEHKTVAPIEYNAEIAEAPYIIAKDEKREVEVEEKTILPQKTEAVKKSFTPLHSTEQEITTADNTVYRATEKHEGIEKRNIVVNENEPIKEEVSVTPKNRNVKTDADVLNQETEHYHDAENTITSTPKNTVENGAERNEEIFVPIRNKENPKRVSENIISETEENREPQQSASVPKLKPVQQKTEHKKAIPVVATADTVKSKASTEIVPTLQENEPTFTQNEVNEAPQKGELKSNNKTEKLQAIIPNTEPKEEKVISDNEITEQYTVDTSHNETEAGEIQTPLPNRDEPIDIQEKQINTIPLPLITDNGNVYVFKNEQKSNSAIVITNNDTEHSIQTEHLPSTVGALHTIIEKASKAGVPVKNIVFKFSKNEGIANNAEVKQSAQEAGISPTKNKEIYSGTKPLIASQPNVLSTNAPDISAMKQEKNVSPIKNDEQTLSAATLLSQKGTDITKPAEKLRINNAPITDDMPKITDTAIRENSTKDDESAKDDTLLKQGIQKPVKTNVKAKNNEQGNYTEWQQNEVHKGETVKTSDKRTDMVNDKATKNTEEREITQQENKSPYSVRENRAQSVENKAQKEYIPEQQYQREESQIYAQENSAKNPNAPIVQQEMNTHYTASVETSAIPIRNIEQNNTVRVNQPNTPKITYNSSDIKKVPADEFAATTHEYMRTRTNENGVVRMVLQPEELGTVTVQYSVRNNEAHLGVQVENQNAKNIIESQLGSLREQFVKQGVHLEKIEVSVKKETEYTSNNNSQSFSNNERGGTTSQQEQESRQAFVRSFKYAAEARKAQTTNYTNSAFNRLFNTNR